MQTDHFKGNRNSVPNCYPTVCPITRQMSQSSDKIPDKQIIEDALYKAWKTTPSKNNAMAYEVVVWGPDKKSEKQIIYNLTQKSCIETEKVGLKEGLAVSVSIGNKYFEHIRTNPYLFTFHQRLATPNEYQKESIEKKGMFFDQAHKSHMNKIIDIVFVLYLYHQSVLILHFHAHQIIHLCLFFYFPLVLPITR